MRVQTSYRKLVLFIKKNQNFRFDENVPEVIENVVEVLKREPGLNLIEVVQEVGRKSNIKNSALLRALNVADSKINLQMY